MNNSIFLILIVSFSIFNQNTVYKTATFKEHHFLGFSIAIPDWQVKESLSLGNQGKIKLEDPLGNDRFFRVDWTQGNTPTIEDYKTSFRKVLDELPPLFRTTNAGKFPVYRYEDKSANKKLALSEYFCETSNISITISSLLNTDWDSAADLHAKVYASIKCDSTVPDFSSAFPVISIPNGYQRVDNQEGLLSYSNKSGDTLIFSSASTLNRALIGVKGKVIGKLLAGYYAQSGIAVSENFKRQGNYYFSQGHIQNEPSERNKIVVMVLHCPDKNYSFNGMHINSRSLPEESYTLLKSAKCP